MVGPRDIALTPGTHWVGRDRDCAVCLDSSGVIDRHTRVDMAVDGKFGVVDLGSASGTRVNGERVVTAGPLGPWDIVRVGDTDLRFLLARAAQTHPPADDKKSTVMANGPDWLAAAGRLHQRLIEQLDIRRRDVSSMSDERSCIGQGFAQSFSSRRVTRVGR